MDDDAYSTPTALLARVREVHAVQRAAEAELLQLAAAWADAHPDLDPPVRGRGFDAHSLGVDPATHGSDPTDRDLDPDYDPLIPAVDWRAPAALAAALGMSTQAGEALIRDALVLRHRLPLVWARVVALDVPVWRARRIAQAVYARPADVSDHLDEHVAAVAERVGPGTLARLVDEAMLRLHAEERELAQLEALDATYVRVEEASINHMGIAEATIRADWKDLADFDATLSDLAHRLEPLHAEEPFQARRARAVGVLSDPVTAAGLLADTPRPLPGAAEPATDATDEATATPAPAAGHRAGHREGRRAVRRGGRRGVQLVVHLSGAALTGTEPLARVETHTGGAGRPVLAQQVAAWCGRVAGEVTVTPVIDLTSPAAVDRYEVGDRMASRARLREPTCVFPWCSRPARACDTDHVVPHSRGGPTSDANLAPLCRRHHRLKTHTAWAYRGLSPGVWLWTDPHGARYLRDHSGTSDVTAAFNAAPNAAPNAARIGNGRGTLRECDAVGAA